GNNVLRDALGGADGLPTPSLAFLMLYAACRHGKWQGKALLRLTAGLAGEGAEALRGAGTVAPELYAALQLPKGSQLAEAPQPSKPRERADCRELEAQVRNLQAEVRQLEAARDRAQTVEGVPVVVTEGVDARVEQRKAVVVALRDYLLYRLTDPVSGNVLWEYPIPETVDLDAYTDAEQAKIALTRGPPNNYNRLYGVDGTAVPNKDIIDKLRFTVWGMGAEPGNNVNEAEQDIQLFINVIQWVSRYGNFDGDLALTMDPTKEPYNGGQPFQNAWPELIEMILSFEDIYFEARFYQQEQGRSNKQAWADKWDKLGLTFATQSFSVDDSPEEKFRKTVLSPEE
ncbi:MAG: hypothetical protein ACPIOQ_79150, partial [Promethearchaeia archaeon]